jgi:uncharacterized protein (DUF983 family)
LGDLFVKATKPQQDGHWPQVSPVSAGLRCACPRCGEGRLYDGMLTPAKKCMVCGLDYAFIDSGDGPAVFVILILGFVILGLALIVDSVLRPPLWLHVIVWIPVIIGLSLWALRVVKAIMIALQFNTAAEEGRRLK